MAESELFSFKTGGKKPSLKQFAAASQPSGGVSSTVHLVSSDSGGSSSGSYYSDDEGTAQRSRRRRKRRVHGRVTQHPAIGKESSIASRLMHNQPITVVLSDSDEDLTSPTKRSRQDSSNGHGRSSSPSLSPSPCPSPPPPPGMVSTPADKKSKKTLDKANNVLNMLRWSAPSTASFSESYSDNYLVMETTPTSAGSKLTLRVRCKGKVHKFEVYKHTVRRVSIMLPVQWSAIRYPCPHAPELQRRHDQPVNGIQGDPLSNVCSQLAKKVDATSGDQLLLSHRNSTLRQSESPASLGLSTADIIDAVVMTKGVNESLSSASSTVYGVGSGGPSITIKVQSSDKSIVYSLSKTDPLQKAMTAFAADLGVSITKLKFTFDGDPIQPTQTAADLDMENDDCIDVRIIS